MKLVQRHGLFHTRTYEIVGGEIVIENNRLASGDTARYQIFDLAEATERYYERAWRWIAGAAVLVVLSLPFIVDAAKLGTGFPLAAAALCWIGAAALAYGYVERSFDKVVFNHWQTGKGLFVVWYNKPSRQEFEAFMAALLEKVRTTRVNPKASPGQKLEVYRNSLAFLVQEGVLTADEAKTFYERKEKAFAREKANVISLVPGPAG